MFTKRKLNFHFNFATIIIIIIVSPSLLYVVNLAARKIITPDVKTKLNFKNEYILKDQFLELNKIIKECLFNTQLATDRALRLKNGWFIVGDHFSNALSESKGLVVFSKEELLRLKEIISSHKDFLNENNIKFYISSPPNKLSVYDSLFLKIRKKDCKTKLEQVDSLCKTIDVSFINLGEDFKNYEDLRLYHKTDTHWNSLGAAIAYSTVVKRLKMDFPDKEFKKFNIYDLEQYTSSPIQGDLARMLITDIHENFICIKLDTVIAKEIVEKKHKIPENYKIDPLHFEKRFINNNESLKSLVFGDSFFSNMTPFFIENFNETVVIRHHIFQKDIILEEKPDIVIMEFLERDLDLLLEK